MQLHLTTIAAAIAMAGFLSACGGDGDQVHIAPTTPSTAVQYAGRVTDLNGKTLPGVSVRLENRTTDQAIETVTAADGSFSIPVEKGVYDIVFDDQGATHYSTLQMLAIDLRSDVKFDVQLTGTQNLLENLLAGSVTNTAGLAEAGRKLLILPSIARAPAAAGVAEVPDPFIVQTDAQGHFSHTLGRAGMDFDFDALVLAANAPELDISPLASSHLFASQETRTAFEQKLQDYLSTYVEESVDIEKPNGAMQMKLVLGSSVRNLRSSTGTASVVPADAQQLDRQEAAASTTTASLQDLWTTARKSAQSAFLGLIPSAQASTLLRKFVFFPILIGSQGKVTEGALTRGKIDINTCKHLSLTQINSGSADPAHPLDANFGDSTSICATTTRGFSWLVYSYEIRLKTLTAGSYRFTDETSDTYSLRVYNPRPTLTGQEHIVRYNSKQPAIVGIQYKLM